MVFCQVLARALESHGYAVSIAQDITQAKQTVAQSVREFAAVDLRIGEESCLTIISELSVANWAMKIVVLTGYASIPTAVEANVELAENPLPLRRLEWEHIQKVLVNGNGHISEAARRLNMHRRTLQRKPQKCPVKSA